MSAFGVDELCVVDLEGAPLRPAASRALAGLVGYVANEGVTKLWGLLTDQRL